MTTKEQIDERERRCIECCLHCKYGDCPGECPDIKKIKGTVKFDGTGRPSKTYEWQGREWTVRELAEKRGVQPRAMYRLLDRHKTAERAMQAVSKPDSRTNC